MTCISVCPA